MKKIQFRSAFGYDEKAASQECALKCEDESLTVQSDLEDSDINTIVRRFGLTGTMPENVRVPTYADFDEVFDYQTAQNALIAARDSFMELPAHVRARFQNDPQQLLEFVADDNNYDEAVSLGLVIKKSSENNSSPDEKVSGDK